MGSKGIESECTELLGAIAKMMGTDAVQDNTTEEWPPSVATTIHIL